MTTPGTISHPIENLESGIKAANNGEPSEQDVVGDEEEVRCDVKLGGRGTKELRGNTRAAEMEWGRVN